MLLVSALIFQFHQNIIIGFSLQRPFKVYALYFRGTDVDLVGRFVLCNKPDTKINYMKTNLKKASLLITGVMVGGSLFAQVTVVTLKSNLPQHSVSRPISFAARLAVYAARMV
jgi:hypothetical protein